MIKISIRNFQSISKAEIEVSGLTVITGRNNTGKSAALRSVIAAFQNAKGSSYIRHGTTKAVVNVSFDDGLGFRWEKGNAPGDKPTYYINDGPPIYPGSSVPEELYELGVRPIVVGDTKVWPQFANQFTGQIFLLDQPGSMIAEAVSDVTNVRILNAALRQSESDRKSTSHLLSVRQKDLDSIHHSIKTKEEVVESLRPIVDTIDQSMTSAQSIRDQLSFVTMAKNEIEGLSGLVSSLEDTILSIGDLDRYDTTMAQQTMADLTFLDGSRTLMNGLQQQVFSYEPIEALSVPSCDMATKILNGIQYLDSTRQEILTAKSWISKSQYLDQVKVEDLSTVVADLTSLSTMILELCSFGVSIKSLTTQVTELITKQDEANRDLFVVSDDISSLIAEIGQCPVCGK